MNHRPATETDMQPKIPTIGTSVMDPAQLLTRRGRREDTGGDTPSKSPQMSVQTPTGTGSETIGKDLRELEASVLGDGHKRRAEDDSNESACSSSNAAIAASFQAEIHSTLDALIARQWDLGCLFETRLAAEHGRQALGLLTLGNSAYNRFEHMSDIENVNKAIEYWEIALALLPEWHMDRVDLLNNLGVAYWTRFRHLGEMSDLNKAIESGWEAVSLTPGGDPYEPQRLSNLGVAYGLRFRRLDKTSDLNEAIAYGSRAISLTPDGHPDKPSILNSLGSTYTVRFERLGEMSDLNAGIAYGSQAASLVPKDHPLKPGILNNLGFAYRIRFQSLSEEWDLNEAVSFGLQALALTPDGHPTKPGTLSNLGATYATRFEYLGEMSDLNNAISSALQAISLIPDGHPDKPRLIRNLGATYMVRFERLGEKSDLDEVIASESQALSLTPDGDPCRPGGLSNLSRAYTNRFSHLGKMSDLNKAIASGSEAVFLIPDGHPDKPLILSHLGNAYSSRFERLGSISDLESAVSAYTNAAQSPTGRLFARFRACREWARLSSLHPILSPRPAYRRAMELLPLLVWVGNTRDRHYKFIAEVSDLSAEAASHAISSEAFDLALEWLEAGRSIIWRQMAQLRTPFDQLGSYNPGLANTLQDVGRKLDQAGWRTATLPKAPDRFGDRDLAREADCHINLALEWDILLKEARSIPGFEDFLRPPKFSQLMSAAQSCPIAVVHCHESSCDALILRPSVNTVSHSPLGSFSHELSSIVRRNLGSLVGHRGFKKIGKPEPGANNPIQLELLKHLWLGLVKPVLDYLGFTHDLPTNQLPHITWCTTGVLSFLPLHAAGCYDQSKVNTFDRVISSYTPTISALLTTQPQPSAHQCGLVAIGQEHTLGFSGLPSVNHELKVIKQHAQVEQYLQLEGSEATVDRVLDAMTRFSCVHVACHGTQDVANPAQSAFHLHDGPLTLAMIASRSFTNKGLAFFSACQTATGDAELPNEAIHLSAGMLMAGFPSVIGTMWNIVDEDGPEVADKVYAELFKDGRMDHTKAARALHLAIAHLRAKVGEKAVERWAPFIHIGS